MNIFFDKFDKRKKIREDENNFDWKQLLELI